MSVYKAVSNYYLEILDFLQLKIKQYDSLDKYYEKLDNTTNMQKELLIKISDCLLKINMLFRSRENYWNSKKKEQNVIFSIFIIIAIIIAIIFYTILYIKIKKEKSTFTMNKIIKLFITYTVIYSVILNVFIMMIINAKKLKTLYEEEANKTRREGSFYIKYMFDKSPINIENILFKLAIASRGSLYSPELIQDDDLEVVNCPVNKNKKDNADDISSYYNCTTKLVNYVDAYRSLKVNLKLSLSGFYNGEGTEDGYYKIRDIYILSGPIPMLKETHRILESYYNISLKDKQGKINVPVSDDSIKKILQNELINPISKIIGNNNKILDIKSYDKSILVPIFKENLDILDKLFLYMTTYCYQIYLQKKANELDSNIAHNLPNNITGTDDFSISIKNEFDKFTKNNLSTYMSIPSTNTIKINEAIENVINNEKFIDLFTNIYIKLQDNVVGDDYFLYDNTIVKTNFMTKMNNYFNETYLNLIKDKMFTLIVLPIKLKIHTNDIKINIAIERISNDLMVYNINFIKYHEFLINELTSNFSSSEIDTKTVLVTDIINKIQKTITLKSQLRDTNNVNKNRFLEEADFLELINKLRYNELKGILDIKHLSNIINKFYQKIGDSIVRDEASMDNIYFNTNKKFKLWQTSIIMTIITIILILSNYTLSNVQLYPYLYTDLNKKIEEKISIIDKFTTTLASTEKTDEKVIDKLTNMKKTTQYELSLLYREKRNRSINFTIRLVIPVFVVVFIITLLLAYYKKAKATHEFNVDLIETNTNTLNKASIDLLNKINLLDDIIPVSDKYKTISELTVINDNQKKEIYNDIQIILEKYEKCNFILEAQKNKLPFPYAEIAMSGFMLFVIILCMLYIYMQINPLNRLKQIKELHKKKQESLIADKKSIKIMKKELEYILQCHEDNIDAVIFTLKVVFFIFIITFLIFYSTKVVNSASEYQMGLYNSGYFDTSTCVQ